MVHKKAVLIIVLALILMLVGCNKAAPSPTSQPVTMFVAAENSYVSFNIPSATTISGTSVSGVATSQNIYLGLTDKITIRLTTDFWEGGTCNLELLYSKNGTGGGTTAAQTDAASQTNPGKYEVTLSYTPISRSNGDVGMYQIWIFNSTSKPIPANIIYTRSNP